MWQERNNKYMCVCLPVCIYIRVCAWVCVYMCACVCIYICVCAYKYIYTHIRCVPVCIYVCLFKCLCVYVPCVCMGTAIGAGEFRAESESFWCVLAPLCWYISVIRVVAGRSSHSMRLLLYIASHALFNSLFFIKTNTNDWKWKKLYPFSQQE